MNIQKGEERVETLFNAAAKSHELPALSLSTCFNTLIPAPMAFGSQLEMVMYK